MQFDVGLTPGPPRPPAGPAELADILHQILLVQREHLEHSKAVAAEHGARWRAMLGRWKQTFPELPAGCKEILPALERAYGDLIVRVVEELRDQGDEALDNDYTLQDFIDRHGARLGQLGHILNLVGPLADTFVEKEKEGASAQEKPQQ